MNFVSVDQDILNFLRVIYFNDISDPFAAASNRAYRDMNRTIRFDDLSDKKRESIRQEVTEFLREAISEIVHTANVDQKAYDLWHFLTCSVIRSMYRDMGVDFYYGQAQKWVNMTIKYLYIVGEFSFEALFPYLHIPIDNYIFQIAKTELGISRPPLAWSRWDDYQKQYMTYQEALRSRIKDLDPLRWEFKFWMKAARNLE